MTNRRPGRDRRAVWHPPEPGHDHARDLGTSPRAVVVGGGLAGMAAATCLAERGVRVELLEREAYLGGRVGGWRTALREGSTVPMNRGFHAFFRQYYNVRALLRRADPELDGLVALADYPLVHRDGYRDTFAGLPRTPLWNAFVFAARSPTFTWRDITRLGMRAALPLTRVSVPGTYDELDDIDSATFLDRLRFPAAARHLAFRVFSRSFFADPAELSAAELAAMFHIYFLGSSEGLLFDVASDCFPIALWQPLQHYLEQRGVRIRTSTPAHSLTSGRLRRFSVRLQEGGDIDADAVVLATDVAGLRALVERSPEPAEARWRDRISRLRNTAPFLVSRLWLDRPVRADRPAFTGTSGFGPLDNISVLERFERSAAHWARTHGGSVVELHSYALTGTPTVDGLRPRLLDELRRLYPETAAATVIDERHELRDDCPLFEPGSFAERPGIATADPDVVLAGDFVRIDLPVALMERAATTGMRAANTLLSRWGLRGHPLWTVPDRGRYALLRQLRRLQGGP
jgi:isorenieratene synthase